MPSISEMEYGYDAAGVQTYLEEIHSGALKNAREAVEDISSIVTCCETEWEGHAREKFVTNLKKDAEHVSQQFESLYNALVGEITSLQAAMANKDEELIIS